jgi:DNA helicase-2/ATP-dependent DNA helicase PcrA
MNTIVWGTASTGKTTRLSELAAKTLKEKENSHVLFLGFQERLGDEFLGLLRVQDGDAGRLANLSFHAFCLNIARQFADKMGFPQPLALISVSEELSLCLWLALGKPESPENIRDALAQIRRLKSELVTPEDYIQDDKHAPQHDTVAWLYPAYQQHLQELGVMDAADLITACVQVLRDIPESGTAVAKAYSQVIIDNAETCTDAQWEIMGLLAKAGVSLAVGIDQNLASATLHTAQWPNTTFVHMKETFRLPEAVSIAVKSLMNHPTPKHTVSPIAYFIGYDDREEADYIATEIRQQRQLAKASFHDVGIVYRSQAQCHYLMDSLEKHKIPYTILGKSIAHATSVLGDLVGYLRLIENPNHQVALIQVLRQAPYQIPAESLRVLRDHMSRHTLNAQGQFDIWPDLSDRHLDMLKMVFTILHELRSSYAETQNIKALLADVMSSSGYSAMLENDDTLSSIEDLENLENYIQNLEEDTPLEGLLADILLTTYDQAERSGDVVSLVNAKNLLGRRFRTVFVCGLEEGIFPHYSAQFDTQILADEKNHFYRSITRSTQYLYLTSAFQRSLYGQVSADDLSRWVLAFPSTILDCVISPRLQDSDIRQKLEARGFQCRIAMPAETTEKNSSLYNVGEWVSHPVFGTGVIQACDGELDQLRVTIAFSDETRQLMAKYAPLTPAGVSGAAPLKKQPSSRQSREDQDAPHVG